MHLGADNPVIRAALGGPVWRRSCVRGLPLTTPDNWLISTRRIVADIVTVLYDILYMARQCIVGKYVKKCAPLKDYGLEGPSG